MFFGILSFRESQGWQILLLTSESSPLSSWLWWESLTLQIPSPQGRSCPDGLNMLTSTASMSPWEALGSLPPQSADCSNCHSLLALYSKWPHWAPTFHSQQLVSSSNLHVHPFVLPIKPQVVLILPSKYFSNIFLLLFLCHNFTCSICFLFSLLTFPLKTYPPHSCQKYLQKWKLDHITTQHNKCW